MCWVSVQGAHDLYMLGSGKTRNDGNGNGNENGNGNGNGNTSVCNKCLVANFCHAAWTSGLDYWIIQTDIMPRSVNENGHHCHYSHVTSSLNSVFCGSAGQDYYC